MSPSALAKLQSNPGTKIQVAIILFTISWALLCLILFLLLGRWAAIERIEHRSLIAVGVSAVLILVRVVYVLLIFFVANSTFNFLNGSPTARLVMSVLEEFGVVFVCLGVGLSLPVRGPEEPSIEGSRIPLREPVYNPFKNQQRAWGGRLS